MKARLIKKAEINESPTRSEQPRASVRTKVSDVIEWVREGRESTSAKGAPSAREKFASLFNQAQTSNG